MSLIHLYVIMAQARANLPLVFNQIFNKIVYPWGTVRMYTVTVYFLLRVKVYDNLIWRKDFMLYKQNSIVQWTTGWDLICESEETISSTFLNL